MNLPISKASGMPAVFLWKTGLSVEARRDRLTIFVADLTVLFAVETSYNRGSLSVTSARVG